MIPAPIFDYEHRGEPAPYPDLPVIAARTCVRCGRPLGTIFCLSYDGPNHVRCSGDDYARSSRW